MWGTGGGDLGIFQAHLTPPGPIASDVHEPIAGYPEDPGRQRNTAGAISWYSFEYSKHHVRS